MDPGAEKGLALASRVSVNCICPLGRWHMVSLADLSQPAGVTAVLDEMEMHFCVSRLLAEHVPGSFPPCAEIGRNTQAWLHQGGQEGANHPCHPSTRAGYAEQARASCLLFLAIWKYRRGRREEKRHRPQAGAVCGGGGGGVKRGQWRPSAAA